MINCPYCVILSNNIHDFFVHVLESHDYEFGVLHSYLIEPATFFNYSNQFSIESDLLLCHLLDYMQDNYQELFP